MNTSPKNFSSISQFARPIVAGVVAISLAWGAQASGQDSAREAAAMEGIEVPEWDLSNLALPDDVFSFARVRYYGGGKWTTDFPGSDLHLSYRLHQLTSLDVNPEPALVELTDASLSDYPMLYMANPHAGRNRGFFGASDAFYLSEDEGEKLRDYLLNGGFLWIDDFWGRAMWENFQNVIKKAVFPDREPVLLDYSHPIFHNIFELDKIPQVPSHDAWRGTPSEGTAEKTYEPVDGEDEEYLSVPRFMAYYDDDGRMCMLVDLNNDIADGWEEEGYATWFFNAFSEKYCFPMAINVLFYVMTN
jgi:hypothetical protein